MQKGTKRHLSLGESVARLVSLGGGEMELSASDTTAIFNVKYITTL